MQDVLIEIMLIKLTVHPKHSVPIIMGSVLDVTFQRLNVTNL